ncbi:MAG: hypothetical protein AAB347_02365 [Bacteroidota bacterium]
MRSYFDNYFATAYPNAVQITTYDGFSSTRRFNCHGYAWHISEGGSDRWIGLGSPYDNDPEYGYWDDGSYVEVIGSVPYPGKVNWSSGDHSAITTENSGILISKWNEYPLMRHAWDDSPYGTSNLKYYKLSISLSGPSTVCPSGTTFTVNNVPVGCTVSWTCSTNITFDNQTGNPKVFTANGTSAGWIQPIIISNCGQIALPRKDVWNVPPTSYITFTVYYSNGVLAPQAGGTWLMCPNTNYHIYINNSSPVQLSNYTWTTPSGWTQNYTYQNMVSVNTNSSPGGQVQVSAFVNDCNNNYNIVTTYFGTYSSCGP